MNRRAGGKVFGRPLPPDRSLHPREVHHCQRYVVRSTASLLKAER